MLPDLDWVLVGAGLHGVHLAAVLRERCGVGAESLALLDPHARPLERWRTHTSAIGMRMLRSPAVHGLECDPFSLRRLAREHRGEAGYETAHPYERPSLRLFDLHATQLVERLELERAQISASVVDLELAPDRVTLHTTQGRIQARHAVLALGLGDQPHWPTWAAAQCDQVERSRLWHVFDPGERARESRPGERTLVIGGGSSAVQLALHLGRSRADGVTLLTRHALRVHLFDSDPGWLGPRNLARFASERDLGARRTAIRAARQRGSIPPETRLELIAQQRRGWVDLRQGAVRELRDLGRVWRVELEDGGALEVERVALATGFEPVRPGGALLDRAIARYALPVAPCGFPRIDPALRWHERLHVSGALAELELGPVARNISGARMAGERLDAFLARERSRALRRGA